MLERRCRIEEHQAVDAERRGSNRAAERDDPRDDGQPSALFASQTRQNHTTVRPTPRSRPLKELPASLWLYTFVASLLYGFEPRDATTLMVAVVVLGAVGVTAALLQAMRAS